MISPTSFFNFNKSSKTFFYSSLYFPDDIKEDVFTLYNFMRFADNLVDSLPQKKQEFIIFRKETDQAMAWKKSQNKIISSFITLLKKRQFNKDWVVSFLDSMQMDLLKKNYRNIIELEKYMYGSSEVIGLMMAKIMNLPPASFPYAKSLGKAMQYINFIRDINQDLNLGRNYLPEDERIKLGLKNLNKKTIYKNKFLFYKYINLQINRYLSWQEYASQGFEFIPKKYLIPIKTASDMYKWTSEKIAQNPLIIYDKTIKPSVGRIIYTLVKNTF